MGAHRLDKLTPEHLEKLYAKIQASGKSAEYVTDGIRNTVAKQVAGLLWEPGGEGKEPSEEANWKARRGVP